MIACAFMVSAFLLVGAVGSNAVQIVTITPNPTWLSVLEGQPGVFAFTVANGGPDRIQIVEVDALVRRPVRGDTEHHLVLHPTLIAGDECTGLVLGLGGTCKFKQVFDTQHQGPMTFMEPGFWDVRNEVTWKTLPKAPFDPVFGDTLGKAPVEVRHTGQPPTIPIPPTLPLMAAALASLGLLWRKRAG